MYVPVTFVDDNYGSIDINEGSILYLTEKSEVIRCNYSDGGVKPMDDRLEQVLVDSRGDTTAAAIATASNVLIPLTGSGGDFDGETIYLNADKIRTYYALPAGGTKVTIEQNSIRPREIIVSDTVSEIRALITAKFTAMITP